MLVILRLARRYISRRFLQSVLFVLGVALGVAMVIAIDVANGSASRAFSLSSASVTGAATHQIVGGSAGLPTDLYHQIRVELGIRASAPVITEYIRAPSLGDQPLRLLGVDPFAEPPFRAYLTTVRVDGQSQIAFDALTAFVARPGAVLISETLAARFGVKTGDTITLRPGASRYEATVVGVLQPDDQVSQQALDDLILTDIATAQDILNMPGRVSRIDLILPESAVDQVSAAITPLLPPGARLAPTRAENDTLSQMTAAFEINLQALSLLALVVGVFLIYNTVTFSVVQRRPVIGIMRAIGATKRQIFLLILGEAFILGIAGTVMGLGLGIIFGRGAVGLVAQTISDLYFTVNVQRIAVEPFTLVKGAAVGLFASLFAALIPSYDATRTVPAGVLRRSDQEATWRRLLPFITAAAVALNIIGLLILQIPVSGTGTLGIVLSFTALFCIVVGGAFFTPVVLVVAMRLFTPIGDRLFGVLGRMAPRAVARSLSRTSVAVAALTIAVSVIVGVSVMIASFRSTVSDWLSTTLGADIYISAPLLTANLATVDVPPEVRERVAETEGIARTSTSRAVSVAAPDFPDLLPVNLIAVDEDIADGRSFLWNNAPDGDYRAALENGLSNGEYAIIVSEPFAYRRDITPENNHLILLTDRGVQAFTIVGVFYDYSTDQGAVLMDNSVYRVLWDDPYISSVAAFLEPDADLAAVIERLRTESLTGYDLVVQPNRELRSGIFTVFDNAFAITIALRLLATVVAFIGILSALLSLQLENTRQYGVMGAIGMTGRQLWNFTLLQTGLMGIVAGLMALPIGLALALVLLYVINVRSFGWTMQFHPTAEEFMLAFGVAVVAALLAGVYPAIRATRLGVARALRSE